MSELENSIVTNEDDLLNRFKKGDVERAKSSLLERFNIWQGILVAIDEQSVITPDDLDHFRVQADDLINQEVKSEHEWEQLKIITVLIYQLMDAEKSARPSSNLELQAQLDMLELPHINQFIMRRITHGAEQFDFADIKNFVRYENLVLSSYITGIPSEEATLSNTVESLQSNDNVFFDLIDTNYEVKIQRRDAAAEIKPVAAPKVEPKPEVVLTGLEPIVICDNDAEFLIHTMQTSRLSSGPTITAASYVGKNREFNEDGIVLAPDNNQVLVIDAMGGYGNGVTARDEFVSATLEHLGDIDANVAEAQQRYDDVGLEQGGVCIINSIIEAVDSQSFRITLAQAGDVHAILFDENHEIKHETVDESIGHQVINAIIGAEATQFQRVNGWDTFGRLTLATLHAKKGWRLVIYSDGIANHFDAKTVAEMISNRTSKQAIGVISKAVDKSMSVQGSYKDNSSIAIVDL